ncbi:polysaccharide biosynthesis/export family protein [Ferrimonas balearica]|uniref:polysaccharide biosynthesis/export family protein n=1 Tax=Ferrimonas balearica TaxID=44012 RepID=UPI001C99651A|nr:polysaccharide biosynthesis/export family protein [Ferrimonas balearica]MBY5923592.1 polysaccharide export protein [Ferrimonas balearica]MBY5997355.1 polysaccharide export protein [Ferrimonas balearica]
MKWFLLFLSVFAASVSADDASGYQLGPGDQIRIQVFGEPDLSIAEIRLSESGAINYPYLGQLKLSGLKLSQVEQLIHRGLKGDYLINPSVSVSIVEYRPFFINGEVRRPGGYPFQPGLTVRKAIALAGGLTERASSRDISLTRKTPNGERIIEVSMASEVLPGDSIYIEDSFF